MNIVHVLKTIWAVDPVMTILTLVACLLCSFTLDVILYSLTWGDIDVDDLYVEGEE